MTCKDGYWEEQVMSQDAFRRSLPDDRGVIRGHHYALTSPQTLLNLSHLQTLHMVLGAGGRNAIGRKEERSVYNAFMN